MGKPRVIVLRAAGTNCDRETQHAFEKAGAIAERVHVGRLVRGQTDLARYDILVIPGGFSYGDDLAAGRIFALELRGRLGEPLQAFVACGKLVMGICNGFQVLVQTGLLPGGESPESGVQRPGSPRTRPGSAGLSSESSDAGHGTLDSGLPRGSVTLTGNVRGRFEARWVLLDVPSGRSIFMRGLTRIELPVAHAEGRFLTRSPEVLRQLEAGGQVACRYAARKGREPAYPQDPNGSEGHVAGICDPSGRVLGLMPHPERYVSRYQHPRWTRDAEGAARDGEDGDGLTLFRNAVEYVT